MTKTIQVTEGTGEITFHDGEARATRVEGERTLVDVPDGLADEIAARYGAEYPIVSAGEAEAVAEVAVEPEKEPEVAPEPEAEPEAEAEAETEATADEV